MKAEAEGFGVGCIGQWTAGGESQCVGSGPG